MHEEGNLQRVNKHDIVNYIYIHITCINSVYNFFRTGVNRYHTESLLL